MKYITTSQWRKNAVVLAAVMAMSMLSSGDLRANHNFAHDQNPNPPAPLGTTDIVSFEAGSIIIPLDGCYARPSFMAKADIATVFGRTATAMKCNTDSQKDDGLIHAYGLAFRLVRAGITVHWAIRAGKTSFHDIDLSITKAGGSPVLHMDVGGSTEDRYSGLVQIDYVGAPFIIAEEDADAARTVMSGLSGFDDVDLHVAQTDFDAPIFRAISELPKLGVLYVDDSADAFHQPQTGFLLSSITDGNLDAAGTWWYMVTTDELIADRLTNESFTLLWIPPFELNSTATARQRQIFAKLAEFNDAGGSILAQDGAIGAFEGDGTYAGAWTQSQPTEVSFQVDGGVLGNGISSTWGNGAGQLARSGDYSDPAAQWGGIVWTGIGGAKANWQPRTDRAYLDGVRRMVYSYDLGEESDSNWDFATWRHYDNDDTKGRIYYLGGYNWRRVTASGFRILLNTIFVHAGSGGSEAYEVSRSSPIVAMVDGIEAQYQGTFERVYPPEVETTYSGAGSNETFEFPHVVGHMRAIATSELTSGAAVSFEDLSPIFDAADGIPPVTASGCSVSFAGTCRTVFTNTATGEDPPMVYVSTANVSALKPLMAPSLNDTDGKTLISRVLAGHLVGSVYEPALGGVDRSTLAIIESSPLAGTTRPTMMYFGGLDGMLHAVCADSVGVCTSAGTELWAFIPRTQLPAMRNNSQRFDGSPKVADVFGDFQGTGTKEWRTVMTFQVGSGDATNASAAPAAYGFDITDPGAPTILWEVATPSSRGTGDMGVGLGVAMGPVQTRTGFQDLTFVQTNNGGTGGAGVYVAAIDTVHGSIEWEFEHQYASARNASNPDVPSTGYPGGVTALDRSGMNTIDRILVPTLYGDLWVIDAADGSNLYGSAPYIRFSEDFHPIGAPASVYRDASTGQLHVVLVTGGYADANPVTWSPTDVIQHAMSFTLELDSGAPFDEDDAGGAGGGFLLDFAAGQRAFAQAVIAGNELFITTDSNDINQAAYGTGDASGMLTRVSLASGAVIGTFAIAGGASSVDVSMGNQTVLTGGGTAVELNKIGGFDSTGSTTELVFEDQSGRRLWLRLR